MNTFNLYQALTSVEGLRAAFSDCKNSSPFDAIRQIRADGSEFWSARDLQGLLGYAKWERFSETIERAKCAARNAGVARVDDQFPSTGKMVDLGSGSQRIVNDFHLSRYASYLVAMNGDPSKPEIAAADVCRALEIGSEQIRRLDDDEYTLLSTQGIPGAKNPEMNILSESGFYSLVLGSRKPEAKLFKRWVTHEVLPAIRKTGRYEASEQPRESSYMKAFKAGILFAMQLPQREAPLQGSLGGGTLRSEHTPQPQTNRVQPAPTYHQKGEGLLPVKIAPWTHPKIEAAKADILAMPTPVSMDEVFAMLKEEHEVTRNRSNEMAVAYILKGAGRLRRKQSRRPGQMWVYDRVA